MMKSIFMTLLLLGAAAAESVKFEDCGSALGEISSLTVVPCPKQPCELKQGSNYSIGINFNTKGTDKNVKALIYGVIDGVEVPFPFGYPDACKGSGLECPLTMGTPYKYTATLNVKSEYPRIKLLVKWELQDTDASKDITCAMLPVAIVGPSPKAPRKLRVH